MIFAYPNAPSLATIEPGVWCGAVTPCQHTP